ncbi:hypothetical protein D9615_006293 [Tricholomella constricta]|uniref:BTB domain-containing protein n=1 Tax=Tricholomella constricta TaxID=117010 RepID=A0A8H5M449_9AGAR|nr:hypothetical protein D9615_006293 [Tricholomella constricta]
MATFDTQAGTAPSRETSGKFRADDADVIFVSSDNVLFYIHRKNLETQAAGFPSAEFDTRGEIVPLTEDASTLELLFQFVYPRRHPDLEATPFDALVSLAEAAEKYEVFSAMNICKIRLRNFLPDHAAEVANFASRHGYRDLLGWAAPFLLDIPLDEIVKMLSLDTVVPWSAGAVQHTRRGPNYPMVPTA